MMFMYFVSIIVDAKIVRSSLESWNSIRKTKKLIGSSSTMGTRSDRV